MASLKHWVRAGTTIATGTTHSGSINGVGTQTTNTEVFSFPDDFAVTGISGQFTEFSASSLDNLKNLVNDVTGDGISIPTAAGQSLFNGNYSTRAFFDNGNAVPSHKDHQGSGDHINVSSASIVDGVVGN